MTLLFHNDEIGSIERRFCQTCGAAVIFVRDPDTDWFPADHETTAGALRCSTSAPRPFVDSEEVA